jgi:hypothetical protein
LRGQSVSKEKDEEEEEEEGGRKEGITSSDSI